MSASTARGPHQALNRITFFPRTHLASKTNLSARNLGGCCDNGTAVGAQVLNLNEWRGCGSYQGGAVINISGEQLALDQQDNTFCHSPAYLTDLPIPVAS